jgi:hypothetical protein
MNVQFLTNEKGKKTAAVVPIKDWEEMQARLKSSLPDFWETLPDYVKTGINTGLSQSKESKTKSHDEIMQKYKKHL